MNPLHLVETGRTPDHLAGDILADDYWNVGLTALSSPRKPAVSPSMEAQRSCPLSRIAVLKALRPPPATLRFFGRLAITLGFLILTGRAIAHDLITASLLGHGTSRFACEIHCGSREKFFVDDLRVGRASYDLRRGSFLTSISGAPNGAVSLSGAGVPTICCFGTACTWTLAECPITDVPMVRS